MCDLVASFLESQRSVSDISSLLLWKLGIYAAYQYSITTNAGKYC